MEKQLNEIYYKIAYKVIDMIPVKWDKVYLLGSVGENQSSYGVTFYFIDSATKEIIRGYEIPQRYNIADNTWGSIWDELAEIIFELNKCFIGNGQEPWDEVEFILDFGGKFDINFNYDINDKRLGILEREIIWAYDKFKYRVDTPYYNGVLKEHFGDLEN